MFKKHFNCWFVVVVIITVTVICIVLYLACTYFFNQIVFKKIKWKIIPSLTRQDKIGALVLQVMGDCVIVSSTMSHHDLHFSAFETAPFGWLNCEGRWGVKMLGCWLMPVLPHINSNCRSELSLIIWIYL